MPDNAQLAGLIVALAIGLLVGVERERGKGRGPTRGAAGLRTFALVALLGAVAEQVGTAGIAVAGAFVALAALAGYRATRGRDPGLTTEVALLLVFLLGVLAMRQAALAAGLGAATALLLAGKSRLHRFARGALSAQELHDALLLAAGAAIVLPLLPDRAVDPWQALNPRRLWLLALIMMALNAAGHIALRALGARRGLLLAGLAGGFVSSTATIAAMGARARAQPALLRDCARAALVSNASTVVQLALVTGALSAALLQALALPLAAAGAAVALATLAWGRPAAAHDADAASTVGGRPFEPRHVLAFVAVVAAVMLGSAMLLEWLGEAALPWTLAASGLADVHAAAATAAQFVAQGRVQAAPAATAMLGALAANSTVKLVVAFATGGARFGWRLVPGVLAMVAAFAAVGLALQP
jgi:uncharacterized membrane protein (DUF4010 family)